MLLGRLPERAALSQLLASARAGRSGVLVMHGEPGVGNTVAGTARRHTPTANFRRRPRLRRDPKIQDRLLSYCAALTGVTL